MLRAGNEQTAGAFRVRIHKGDSMLSTLGTCQVAWRGIAPAHIPGHFARSLIEELVGRMMQLVGSLVGAARMALHALDGMPSRTASAAVASEEIYRGSS